MGTVTGDGGAVEVGGAAILAITEFTLNEQGGTVDSTVMGQTARSFKPNKTQWDGSITCYWDPDDATGQEALAIGTEVSLSLEPEGSGTTGDTYYTGAAIITGREIAAPQDGMVGRVFQFQGTGALTKVVDP